jgi:aryl-alcohol dehydrogenase-like predicted oxidoreductase
MDDLVRSGKVRYAGCSNYPAWQLALALSSSERHGWARYDCAQPRYNVLYREIEAELLPLCRDQGVGVIVYNPLAGGFLSGKHSPQAAPQLGTRFTMGASGELYRERYWHAAQFEAVGRLKGYCQERGWNLATASIAWVLAQAGITSAIVGASRPDQLDATLAAVELDFDDDARSTFGEVWWSLPRRPTTR